MNDKYTFKVDFKAKKYIGIHLDWDYKKWELIYSIKGYVQQALTKLKHIAIARHQAAPSKIKRPNYGAKIQYVDNNPTLPLTLLQIKHIQCSLHKFLYYSCTIEITIKHSLNDIAADASNGTKATNKGIKNFIDYSHSNPDAKLIFRASDMILSTDSNASYLVAKNSHSQAGGYHYCESNDGKLFNGIFCTLAKISKSVMASAMEA